MGARDTQGFDIAMVKINVGTKYRFNFHLNY